MWYPNRSQWRVIWIAAPIGLLFWLTGDQGAERLGIVVLAIAALVVWRLAMPKQSR